MNSDSFSAVRWISTYFEPIPDPVSGMVIAITIRMQLCRMYEGVK